MDRSISSAVFPAAAVAAAFLLTGCGSTGHRLPTYEPPLARTNYQNVRTTAYTHTESDHLEYGNHNALGGTLHAAGPAVMIAASAPLSVGPPVPSSLRSPASATAANSDDGAGGFQRVSNPGPAAVAVAPAPYAAEAAAPPVVYGSAAADWSRWPAGTTFRIESTGQYYRVDDYGWALSGRNTIDLYQPTRSAMNAWGVRHEPIQILEWGDKAESLRRLRNHQKYRHIKRMVLELEGHNRAAARLQ